MSLADEFKALALEIYQSTGCPMADALREASRTMYDLFVYYDDPRPLTIDNRVPPGVLRALATCGERVEV